ncbi:MAG: diaminopimelate dehydrogenase [Syntrophales bacterium]|nr:diaminopimelate dehydrogenase [Syntrophales bacterium]MCK9527483.1 diaminopimelate dehydrogenase [Syntrophales bacterium]MDX9922539.1 diaminopimelate dehydrogenase [Syntrophales bacterium]
MSERIRIGIIGYGNIGQAAEKEAASAPDMDVRGIFTRRAPSSITPANGEIPVYHVDDAPAFIPDIDVAILCGGSVTDLPEQGPRFAGMFNTVDSYDTHARIPEYFEAVDAAARQAGTTAVIATGWDPGLFSLVRVLEEAFLPRGTSYTFWGPGVSQGHSDAIRRIEGVLDARQYTLPTDSALDRVRSGDEPILSTGEKHLRICYVVAREGADQAAIEASIKAMPHYFAGYDTRVTFISPEEMRERHGAMPHGGCVVRSARTADNSKQLMELCLKLESNPYFTASILIAYARAAFRLNREGSVGAKTVFDIAPSYLTTRTSEELRRTEL